MPRRRRAPEPAVDEASDALARWYERHGRHDLPWRATNDPWGLLVAEVMLHQTQVGRVEVAWPRFMARFPDPATTAAAPPADVIAQWENLGYPRRARFLWEAARTVAASGWPADLRELPGVGRYTAGALRAQLGDDTAIGVDTNIRRVAERCAGTRLTDAAAEAAAMELGEPLTGRDRFLALMDVGAGLCTPRNPSCARCPLRPRCRTRGALAAPTRDRAQPYAGSFRQRRGRALAALRAGAVPTEELDGEALRSLVDDGLAEISGRTARLPRS